MRILVCGGRDFSDRKTLFDALDRISAQRHPADRLTVIQGGASGADHMARQWAMEQPSVWVINEPADWKTHGKAAGPIRNQKMIDEHRPDIVLAFAGGRGTADMVRRAKAAKLHVIEVGR
jgi:hypothetical protein